MPACPLPAGMPVSGSVASLAITVASRGRGGHRPLPAARLCQAWCHNSVARWHAVMPPSCCTNNCTSDSSNCQLSPSRVALLALLWKLLLLLLTPAVDFLFCDYDSSSTLDIKLASQADVCDSLANDFQCPIPGVAVPASLGAAPPRALKSLMVWDSVFMMDIASHGYQYEHYYAFFPLLPALSSVLGPAWSPAIAIIVTTICFVAMVVLFSIISSHELQDSVINCGFILHEGLQRAATAVFASETRWSRFSNTTHHLFVSALAAAVVVAPVAAFQLHGFLAFCPGAASAWLHTPTGAGGKLLGIPWQHCLVRLLGLPTLKQEATGKLLDRPWCQWTVPRIYNYVQERYWGLPNFLLAAPALLLALAGCWTYVSHNSVHMLTGGLLLGRSKSGSTKSGFLNPRVGVFIYPWAFMTLTATFVMHVQVATRFLSSCPPMYWYMAHLCSSRQSSNGTSLGHVKQATTIVSSDAYINGPFNMMGEILEEVRKQRVDCIVIVPLWPNPWRDILPELPIRDTWDLPIRSDLWQPGALILGGEGVVPPNNRKLPCCSVAFCNVHVGGFDYLASGFQQPLTRLQDASGLHTSLQPTCDKMLAASGCKDTQIKVIYDYLITGLPYTQDGTLHLFIASSGLFVCLSFLSASDEHRSNSVSPIP
eukprot:gene7368-491_t